MHLQDRIHALINLGSLLGKIGNEDLTFLHQAAKANNGWFTPENVDRALAGVAKWLSAENLSVWLGRYNLPDENPFPKKIGIVMAGNIPLVGFHDFLSVLITGNIAQAKLSSQDPALLKFVVEKLIAIEPRFRDQIEFVERLNQMDAVIATGSDNTSRYFDYYFGKYPHIIRKNRNSCAVLNGSETPEDFFELGKDIFYYFGLGCRNISKIYVPNKYDFRPLIEGLKSYDYVMDNHKYANNYNYHRAVFLVDQTPHLDSGFCLFKRDERLASPTSVIHFSEFVFDDAVKEELFSKQNSIQCVVSKNGWFSYSIPFGQAQEPNLWDYADRVDTIHFLMKLK